MCERGSRALWVAIVQAYIKMQAEGAFGSKPISSSTPCLQHKFLPLDSYPEFLSCLPTVMNLVMKD